MPATDERTLSWKSFLAEVIGPASEALRDPSPAGIENYLGILAAGACRLDLETIGKVPPDAPFRLVPWRLEPGETTSYRPHPGSSVCTLLLEGAARGRCFQFADALDWKAKGKVRLQFTREDLLHPGSLHLVGNPFDNIRGFRAGPEGARGIDITTVHRGDAVRPASVLEIADTPEDPDRRIYAALWRDGE